LGGHLILSGFTRRNRTEVHVGNRQFWVFNNQMGRYFFNIVRSDMSRVLDDEGEEFLNYELAKREAVESIRDIVCDAIKHGGKVTGVGIEIVDQTGKVLETLRARDIRLGRAPIPTAFPFAADRMMRGVAECPLLAQSGHWPGRG
jgi:hypothetical protein